MRRRLSPLLLLAALIGAWQVAASTGAIADALNLEDFPSPRRRKSPAPSGRTGACSPKPWVTRPDAAGHPLRAGGRALGFAVAMHRWEVLRNAAYPLIVASQTVPIVYVIAPILVRRFGYGIVPKVVIVALVCFFPITVASLDGLRSVHPDAVTTASRSACRRRTSR